MAIYYLCSGFGMENCFVNKFGELLSKDLKSTKSMVAIPCSDDEELINGHLEFFKAQLEKAGIYFECVLAVSGKMSGEEIRKNIKSADMLYLMGGYPFEQKQFIEKNGISDALRSFDKVILGISAGAMNMSEYIIMVTDGENSDQTRVESGLSLVDFSVFPHCAFSSDEFAQSFKIGRDTVYSQKLIEACKGRGDVYFLQNKDDKDNLKISFIRVENNKKDFVSIYNGKVWKLTPSGFEIEKEYV